MIKIFVGRYSYWISVYFFRTRPCILIRQTLGFTDDNIIYLLSRRHRPPRGLHNFFWQHTHTISSYFLLILYQACHGRIWSFQSVFFFCFILPRNMNGYLALYVNIWIKTMSLNWVESLAQARFKFIYTNYSNTLESAGHFYDATRLNRVSRTCSWLVRTGLCLYTTSQR